MFVLAVRSALGRAGRSRTNNVAKDEKYPEVVHVFHFLDPLMDVFGMQPMIFETIIALVRQAVYGERADSPEE